MTYTNQSAVPSPRPVQTQPYQFLQNHTQVSQPIFPQPSGNIYFVNNSLEVANIPVGVGTSAVLCLPENLIYLKSMQNGMPMLLGYKISPLESPMAAPTQENSAVDSNSSTTAPQSQDDFKEQFDTFKQQYEDKIKSFEETLSQLEDKIGGLVKCQF